MNMRARIRDMQRAELDMLEAAELADADKIGIERMRLEAEKHGQI